MRELGGPVERRLRGPVQGEQLDPALTARTPQRRTARTGRLGRDPRRLPCRTPHVGPGRERLAGELESPRAAVSVRAVSGREGSRRKTELRGDELRQRVLALVELARRAQQLDRADDPPVRARGRNQHSGGAHALGRARRHRGHDPEGELVGRDPRARELCGQRGAGGRDRARDELAAVGLEQPDDRDVRVRGLGGRDRNRAERLAQVARCRERLGGAREPLLGQAPGFDGHPAKYGPHA